MWSVSERRQSPARIQQLYGEIKYRSVYLLAGMKERHSRIVDDSLSSGDLTRSNNARPIPGIAAGFLDFVDIPLTNGWVQIDGEIMYGKFTDSKYKEQTFNYYSGNLATDLWYIYRRCYFRTKPSQPLSLTIGMQAAGQFGGRTVYYTRGKVRRTDVGPGNFAGPLPMALIPDTSLWHIEIACPDLRAAEGTEYTYVVTGDDGRERRREWHPHVIPAIDPSTPSLAHTVVKQLVDIVSKNGNLLLSIPLRADGTYDEKEAAVLDGIEAWMTVNKESIIGTRPWVRFGEGPVAEKDIKLNAQGFNDGQYSNMTAADIRFNQSRKYLYTSL